MADAESGVETKPALGALPAAEEDVLLGVVGTKKAVFLIPKKLLNS